MPLPPLPKAMGSILKEGEMTVKPASNPKSFKTAVKEKQVQLAETGEEIRYLDKPQPDELYKVLG